MPSTSLSNGKSGMVVHSQSIHHSGNLLFKSHFQKQSLLLLYLLPAHCKNWFISEWAAKNLPAMQEMQDTWAQSLDQEDTLEEEMATHSSILARKISWTDKPVHESQRVGHNWATEHIHTLVVPREREGYKNLGVNLTKH